MKKFIVLLVLSLFCSSANAVDVVDRLQQNLIALGALQDSHPSTIQAIFRGQKAETRVFHELDKHGAMAIDIIKANHTAQHKIKEIVRVMAQYGWQRRQIEALLDIIGLTHDAVYHTDGAIAPQAQQIIMQVMQFHNTGLVFRPEATQYITYQLVQQINEYNKAKPFHQQMGIKYPTQGVYGRVENGAIFPQAGVGQNELFSAILAEYLLREAQVPAEWQFIIIAAILETVPFTSPAYHQHFQHSLQILAKQYHRQIPDVLLADMAAQIAQIFTNYFDIANYRDGSKLVVYHKLITLEQKAEMNAMFRAGQEDWLLIAISALEDNFHQTILKPRLATGELVIFHGSDDDIALNNAAIKAIDYEAMFVKARAVGAFLQQCAQLGCDADASLANLYKSSNPSDEAAISVEIQDKILANLLSHAKYVPAMHKDSAIAMGYKSDKLVAARIKQHGLSYVINIAELLKHQIAGANDTASKKQKLELLLYPNS